MIKIAVFDCGFGGEMLADRIKEELPFAEIIRVIDWRHASEINSSPHLARKYAKIALSPYIGQVDAVVFANFLLSATSLKHFRRNYPDQKFIGINFKYPDTFIRRKIIILTTDSLTKTLNYYKFIVRLRRRTIIFKVDSWDSKIDDGELTESEIGDSLANLPLEINNKTVEIILAHANLVDIIPCLKNLYGQNLRIYDSFNDTIRKLFKELGIRGGVSKK